MPATPGRQATQEMRTLQLPSGRTIPILGQGTWLMGEDRTKRPGEMAALRLGLELGMTLIDTAEMYGDGAAETLIGEVIKGRRQEVFLVSKVLPNHATLQGTIEACGASLRRLETDYLNLYLLHWRGEIPLSETLEAFQLLKRAGKILDYGVSNFDVDEMKEAVGLPSGDEIVTNQVLYNLKHRGIEWDLLPWCRQRGIPIMAYSPIEHSPREQRGMLDNSQLKLIATRHGATPAQVALAWVLRQQVVAIPKSGKPEHVQQNRAALQIELTDAELAELDQAFPPPRHKVPLEVK